MKIGDKVIWHTGNYAGEQGQREKSWWVSDKVGHIKELKTDDFGNEMVLIVVADHSMTWDYLKNVHPFETKEQCERCQWWAKMVGVVQ
jgi:hypothetical protein